MREHPTVFYISLTVVLETVERKPTIVLHRERIKNLILCGLLDNYFFASIFLESAFYFLIFYLKFAFHIIIENRECFGLQGTLKNI